MIELLRELSPKELLLNSTIIALIFRFVWGAFSEVSNRLRQFFSRRVRDYEIYLGLYRPEFDDLIDFHCLLIRYGTDSYLQGLASEQDKFDGRLQNKILPVTVEATEDGKTRFVLRLPVHQRIGTQFKCFAEVKHTEDLETAKETLNTCERIHGVSESSSQFKNRVYFLLNDFGTSKSVDGIENNVCFPV